MLCSEMQGLRWNVVHRMVDNHWWHLFKSFSHSKKRNKNVCVCVFVDHQGIDSGAESSLLTVLLTESRLWEKWEGVHSIALPRLCHHLRHHDRLGSNSLSSSRSTGPREDEGPLAEWRGAPPPGTAETHTTQVQHRLFFLFCFGMSKEFKVISRAGYTHSAY